ncbi:MAG: GTP-binding protein [Candidatus Thermoplasmatota archaeon]|nr:GTP-binding protein [Candidatus Thermoplasmatota archaeon]
MATEYQMKSKVCLVGEAAVGKTSLIRRFIQDVFDDKYITTLGAKVSKKEFLVEVPERDLSINMDMVIWDIMGEKGIRDLLREAFFQGAQGILAVCDLTRYSTLRELDDWIQSVYNVAGDVATMYAINKVDLKDEIMLLFGEKEIEMAAQAFDASYFYTSAKTGENVQLAFQTLADEIVRRNLKADVIRLEP